MKSILLFHLTFVIIQSYFQLNVKDGFTEDSNEKTEAMKILEKQISQLRSENEAMEGQLQKVKDDADAGAVDLIEKMTEHLTDANHTSDSLRKINQELLSKYDLLQEELYNTKDELKKLESAPKETEVKEEVVAVVEEEKEIIEKEEEVEEETTTENESKEEAEEVVSEDENDSKSASKITKRLFKTEKAVLKIN